MTAKWICLQKSRLSGGPHWPGEPLQHCCSWPTKLVCNECRFMNVKKPKYMSACSSCSVFCQISAEPGRLTLRHAVQPWDILSDVESYFTQIHCQEAHDKIESSLMFCQDSQWDRMSNLQTGCPTSRHTVWSWDMPHTRSLPRRLLQDCIQALSYFVKTINEPECLVLRQAVQLQDILSNPETCLTQDYCQDARDKIACKLSHRFSRKSMSILCDCETGLRQCGKTSRDLALGLS